VRNVADLKRTNHQVTGGHRASTQKLKVAADPGGWISDSFRGSCLRRVAILPPDDGVEVKPRGAGCVERGCRWVD